MLENHGSQEGIARALLYWASLPEACRLALPIHGNFATPSPLQLPPARGASEGEQAFRSANGHMVIKPSTIVKGRRQASTASDATRGRG